jgi:ParB family chromosome partitioning protein
MFSVIRIADIGQKLTAGQLSLTVSWLYAHVTPMPTALKTHPAVDQYGREMSEGEMAVLMESIKRDGQRLPITLQEGTDLIIDGRNRAAACAALGVEPQVVKVQCDDEGANLIAFQLNIARRHDSEMDRAFIAAGLCNVANGGDRVSSLSRDRVADGLVSAEKAASMVNLSTPTVSRAKKCLLTDEKYFDSKPVLSDLAKGETKQSLQNLAWTASQLDKGTISVELVKEAVEAITSGHDNGESDLKKQIKRIERRRRDEETLKALSGDDSDQPDLDVKHGQFWKLGRHVLYCGDTSSDEFRDYLPEKAALAFADPPYGAKVTERPTGGAPVHWDDEFYWQHDYLVDKADIVAVTPGNVNLFQFIRNTKMPYICPHATWISNGMTVVGPMGFTNWICTFLFAEDRKKIFGHFQDFFKVTINNEETGDTAHRGRKPMALLVELINMYVKPSTSQLIVDPFAGSGTTLLAAESTGVSCITGELDPGYCLSIIARWQKISGGTAEAMK